jgi:hypothetical protein
MAQPGSKNQYSWRTISAVAAGLGAFGLIYGLLQISLEAGIGIGLLIIVATVIFGIIMRALHGHSRQTPS